MSEKIIESYKLKKNNCKYIHNNKLSLSDISFKSANFKNLEFLKQSIELFEYGYYLDHLCFLNNYKSILTLKPYPLSSYLNEEAFFFQLKLYVLLEFKPVYIYELKEENMAVLFYKKSDKIAKKFSFILNLIKKAKKGKYNFKLSLDELITLYNKYYNLDYNEVQHINNYLRIYFAFKQNIDSQKFWEYCSKMKDKNKKSEYLVNKYIDKYFQKLKKENPDYVESIINDYKKNIKIAEKKIENAMKSKTYEKFSKVFDKNCKKFKYPLKEAFGPRKQITYECFKERLDIFRNEYKKLYAKNKKIFN